MTGLDEALAYVVRAPGSPVRVAVIAFDPSDPPQDHLVYGDAAASQLIPVLRSILARLESGALRTPLAPGEPWAACEP